MVINWDINSKEHSLPELQKYFSDFKRLRPYYYSDYYPLTKTGNMTNDNVWLAYQLNRPEQNDGIIMAFRRKNCPEGSIVVQLRGIDRNSNYQLFNEDSVEKEVKTGNELMNGLTLFLKENPKSLLIHYQKLP